MCFLFVSFFMPFPLFPKFPYLLILTLSRQFCFLFHWEKKMQSKEISTGLPMTSHHLAAPGPIYSAFSSTKDTLFILLAKSHPSCLLSDLVLAILHSVLHQLPYVLSVFFSVSVLSALWRQPRGWCGPQWKWVWHPCCKPTPRAKLPMAF